MTQAANGNAMKSQNWQKGGAACIAARTPGTRVDSIRGPAQLVWLSGNGLVVTAASATWTLANSLIVIPGYPGTRVGTYPGTKRLLAGRDPPPGLDSS
eukprot:1740666-Rhodomonas_salina.4